MNILISGRTSLHSRAEKPFRGQIEALSKAGGVRYTINEGPDRLCASADGKRSWMPPKELADGDAVTAVVTISDSSGQQRFRTLRISAV